MRSRNPETSGFTLLELVVVLSILAVVTTLALRGLGGIEDGKRDEANRAAIEDLREAILGSPDERAADGPRVIAGYVADMGRLPRTVEVDGALTLAELWSGPPGQVFDVRPAIAFHGVPGAFEDPQVFVSGGWRGPYLRLPLGASQWLDGWGNPMVNVLDTATLNPDAEGYARLRDTADAPLVAAGQEIRIIRHLGSNGQLGASDTGYGRDGFLSFPDESHQSALTAQIEVMDGEDAANVDPTRQITLCVFSPNPADASKIIVASASAIFDRNPLVLTVPGLTQGPRVARAYQHPAADPPNSSRKSGVRHPVLRPGANFIEMRIDR
jgi:prepilin-type N-terminal cleavage/methylation domain-containing protein